MHQGVDRFFCEVCGLEAGEVLFSSMKVTIIVKWGFSLTHQTFVCHCRHTQTHETQTYEREFFVFECFQMLLLHFCF